MRFVKSFRCYLPLIGRFNQPFGKFSTNLGSMTKLTENGLPLTPDNITYGQPTFLTHPHLIKSGEIIVGIQVSELQERRNSLMVNIQKSSMEIQKNLENHIVVIPSGTKKYMSDKIPYVFRQNTEFYYFSGCLEPDSILMLTIDKNKCITSTLFMRPKDTHAELWDGSRTGVENAPAFFGVTEAYDIKKFDSILLNYKKNLQRHLNDPIIWYDENTSDQTYLNSLIKKVAEKSINVQSPSSFFHNLRLYKSESEIALMRKTCQIASESINETMCESRPGDSEHYLFARLDYKCRMKGASFLAYPPVVASGNNSTTIHYINNSQVIRNGDLVLVDSGCEYGGYTSDITRTWPINGNFTQPQLVLYEVLLQIQKDLIGCLCKSGGKTLDELFETMCFLIGKYLQDVGIVAKSLKTSELKLVGFKFCPHHVSHYLGMDVHDTPLISRSTPLGPGMVFTVEPGIYISKDRFDAPEEFRGIGIRIEDDILIDLSGNIEILTQSCVREPSEIKNLIGESL